MRTLLTGRVVTLAVCALASAHAHATTLTPSTTPGAASRPPSAFADYKPYRDIEPADWRRLNDTVGQAALPPAPAHSPAHSPASTTPAPGPTPRATPAQQPPSAPPKAAAHGMHGHHHRHAPSTGDRP